MIEPAEFSFEQIKASGTNAANYKLIEFSFTTCSHQHKLCCRRFSGASATSAALQLCTGRIVGSKCILILVLTCDSFSDAFVVSCCEGITDKILHSTLFHLRFFPIFQMKLEDSYVLLVPGSIQSETEMVFYLVLAFRVQERREQGKKEK